MLSSWSAEGLIVPYDTTEIFTLTIGQAVYTIGVTGDSPDLVTATGRPLRIKSAFIRQSNIDYPIDVKMTEKEYNRIVSKDVEQRPQRLWYDPQYPKGTIRFDFEADVAYAFHLISEKALTDVTAKTDTLSLPLYMNIAFVFNLALILAPQKKVKLEPHVLIMARESKRTVENFNARNKLRNKVDIDRGLTYGVMRS